MVPDLLPTHNVQCLRNIVGDEAITTGNKVFIETWILHGLVEVLLGWLVRGVVVVGGGVVVVEAGVVVVVNAGARLGFITNPKSRKALTLS